jgi:hypothetical protein
MIDFMIAQRGEILEMVFRDRDGCNVNLPVAFQYIIKNIQGQQMINMNSMSDISPMEAFEIIDDTFKAASGIKARRAYRAIQGRILLQYVTQTPC